MVIQDAVKHVALSFALYSNDSGMNKFQISAKAILEHSQLDTLFLTPFFFDLLESELSGLGFHLLLQDSTTYVIQRRVKSVKPISAAHLAQYQRMTSEEIETLLKQAKANQKQDTLS